MKILHILPSLKKGGAERLCLDMVRAQNKIPGVSAEIIILNNLNEYQNEFEEINPLFINARINLSIIRPWKIFVKDLETEIKDFKPDIIHTHLFEAEIVSRFCHYPPAKWFSHCHDNMVQFSNIGIGSLFSKLTLTNYFEKKVLFSKYKQNGGTHFIAISKDTESYFKKTAKPYPVTLLPNAIDYQKFLNPDQKNRPGNVLRLINIGSFVEKKNQAFLLNVADELKKKKIHFKLHLIGDGVKRPELETHVRNLDLGNEVVFHGMVDQVEKVLWQSNIYVHSATYEPLGLVLLEAMAAGLPVITLDGKGNRDLIVQGKNGFMMLEQDAEKFADKILEVWENKELYREMSSYAQEFAKGYDIKGYVVRLLEVYKQAL